MKLFTETQVAKLLISLTQCESACDVNGVDEWLPKKCKYAKTTCPFPEEKYGCWREYIRNSIISNRIELDYDLIAKKYEVERKSLNEIAKELKVSQTTIRNFWKNNGGKLHPLSYTNGKRKNPILYPNIERKMEEKFLTYTQLAKEIGYKTDQVRRVLTTTWNPNNEIKEYIADYLDLDYISAWEKRND